MVERAVLPDEVYGREGGVIEGEEEGEGKEEELRGV